MSARFLLLLAPLLLSACYDQPVANDFGSTTPPLAPPPSANSTLADQMTPVRIGELGANFAACNAQGEVRDGVADGAIPVRTAPFEEARPASTLPAGATFFICSRSLDQHWFGIVYQAPGRADRACGVSTPVPSRRDYRGSCESGWVSSAQVRMISGVQAPADPSSGNSAQSK